jgi:hypothetical protein
MAKNDRDSLADALSRMSHATSGATGEGTGGNADEPAGITPAADGSTPSAGASTPAYDDQVIAPPPPRSAFAPKRSTRELLAERQLGVKRTVIPILLTCGVLLIAGGALRWIGGVGLPFAAWDARLAAGLIACGFAVLLVGVVNMLHVRDALLRRGSGPQRTRPRHGV